MAPSPLQSGGNPFPPAPPVYLTTSSSFTLLAFKGTLKRKERSDSIRSIGFAEDHQFNVRWLKEASRILKPDGTIWVTGTHHIIFSLGFALQTMRFKIINQITWAKPDPPPNALHTRACGKLRRALKKLGEGSLREEAP
jgi:site-specific DNA-methyltransferase (adenine-specific)